jgi:hypothetical protein
MRPTSCSPRWTPPRASAVAGRRQARCRCRTPWASSATCRTSWSRPSRPRCRRRPMPTCCCTWSMPPARIVLEQQRRSRARAGRDRRREVPQLLVYNKCDLLDAAPPARAGRTGSSAPTACARAACLRQRAHGAGLDALREVLADYAARALESPPTQAPSDGCARPALRCPATRAFQPLPLPTPCLTHDHPRPALRQPG